MYLSRSEVIAVFYELKKPCEIEMITAVDRYQQNNNLIIKLNRAYSI